MENNNNEQQIIKVVSESALPEIIRAEIDTQIATAKSFPRSLTAFKERAMSMAIFNEEVAESCSYSLPRAGKTIEGASVRLAEIVVSSFGNIRSGARVIANDGKVITAQGICHDLETNNSVTVEVRRKITDKNGRTFSEDMQVVTGNAACAIAFRNAVFKVVPFALVQEIYDKAKEVAKGTTETLVKRRDRAIEYFRSLKVTDQQVCEILQIKKIEDIDLDKLSVLTGMRAAIKNGEITVKELFSPEKNEISLEDLQLLFDMKKTSLSVEEINDANRIIQQKEVKSYAKLHKILEAK